MGVAARGRCRGAHGFAVTAIAGEGTLCAMAYSSGPDRSRTMLALAVILWVSAAAAVFIGVKTRAKPILLVGMVDGMLALAVTVMALRGGTRSS